MSRTLSERTAAASLAVAGVLFAVYPAVRPYSDETTLAGAAAMASPAWVAAHGAGMLAFTALTLGVAALATAHLSTPRAGALATLLTWLGTSLVLPYYGAETFGLQVVADRALSDSDATLLGLAETFRYGPVALPVFAAGLLTLASAGVALTLAVRRAGVLARAGGALAGLGLVLYLPQFFGTPALRIGHGVLLAAGCLLLAAAVLRRERSGPARAAGSEVHRLPAAPAGAR